jgi:hypothetical protein
MTYTNVLSEPKVPVKKGDPFSWIGLLFSSFGTLVFSFSTQFKREL